MLPGTERYRRAHPAGQRTRVHVTDGDAKDDLTVGPWQLRLGHAATGIHRDPDTGQRHILQPEGG